MPIVAMLFTAGEFPTFSLVIGPSQLAVMPFVGVLFTECEFPPFLL